LNFFTMPVDVRQAFTEFLGMALFVWVGCGAATASYGVFASQTEFIDTLPVATAFGLAITVVVYATAHVGSGQLNPAVTFGLGLAGNLEWMQVLVNVLCQMLGAILGVAFVLGMTSKIPPEMNSLGTNGVNTSGDITVGNAVVGEIVGTFLLVFTVFQTAVSKESGANSNQEGKQWSSTLAPLPIGFAVLVDHIILIPIDGCSINPARSFGASVVAAANGFPDAFKDHWIWWVAPLIGSACAAATWILVYKPHEDTTEEQLKADMEMARGASAPETTADDFRST
jgi:MIP family channel proteins